MWICSRGKNSSHRFSCTPYALLMMYSWLLVKKIIDINIFTTNTVAMRIMSYRHRQHLSILRRYLHSKNTCVGHAQVCVLQNARLLSYVDIRFTWFNTSTCVEMTTQILCGTCSAHLKFSVASEKRTYDIMHQRRVSYHWYVLSLIRAITDTCYHWYVLQLHYSNVNSYFGNYVD